jgi:hypothetical protein
MLEPSQHRPPILCLWGGHRPCPDLDSHLTPSNADKGARELKARGYQVQSISPWSPGRRRISELERRSKYVARVRQLLRAAKDPKTVIYTADRPWIKVVAALKRAGLLRRRVVAHWGGYDFDPLSLSNPSYLKSFKRLFSTIDAIWFASENERRIWANALPELAGRMAFHPMFIDLAYYRSVVPAALVHDVVAIGTDSRRDWEVPIGLAASGLRVAIVTGDKEVRRRVQSLPVTVQNNITLAFQSGFQQSARIAAAGRCILVATTPNFRFSGSTTLSVAIALGKPLVIDDPFDLPAYGLQPGVHCETFERGNKASALAAVHRILADPRYAAGLAAALSSQRDSVSIDSYVDQLEASFRPEWAPAPVANAGSPLRLARPDAVAAWP